MFMKPLLILLLVTAFAGCSQKERPLTINQLLTTVSGDSIRSHIAFLADDSLKGRLPGTPEYTIAVDYVVDQYKSLGLEPSGEDYTYLQDIVIRRGIVDHDNSLLAIAVGKESIHWINGKDYVFLGDLNAASNEVSAPVVYVEYGIDAPSLDHCDYCDTDVKDKIVIVRSGAPETFPPTELAHFSNLGTKFETAINNGALGLILTSPEANFERIASRYMSTGNTGVVGPDGLAFGRRVFGPGLKFVAMVNWESLQILTGNNPNFDLPYDFSISAKTTTIFTEFRSPNVIGKLEGGDPELSGEYIVHTAHLDHVGIGKPVNGDSIYNGAHDNASGVASLLEIARLYTNLSEKPRRSILFVMVTAEEMGLLGSDYFTRYPTVPLDKIIANINTDMPTLIAPLLSIEPIGAEHSSIMKNVEEAAEKLNLEIMPDHMPEQVRFVRSDQYNFIRQGIPALHVKYGLKSLDSLNDLSEQINDYTATIYHKPSDELNDLFDFEAGEVYVKLNFLISYSISQSDDRPAWNEGDFFSIQ
jgi:hypothetical protein